MANAVLYSEPVSYPTISAVANGKLEVEKKDILSVAVPVTEVAIVGSRPATTDPWEIQIQEDQMRQVKYLFSAGAFSINPDDLGWKSMADLTLKEHNRPSNSMTWALENVVLEGSDTYTAVNGLVISDASQPAGIKNVNLNEAKVAVKALLDEAGDFAIQYIGTNASGVAFCARAVFLNALTKAITTILGNTTSTSVTITIPAVLNLYSEMDAELTNQYALKQATGTDAINIGNYGIGRRKVTVESAAPGVEPIFHSRLVGSGGAISVPSILMDSLRKASKANQKARVSIVASSKGEAASLTSLNQLSLLSALANNDVVIARVCAGDPDGHVEIAFDQANSLNVLATAAFAGLGGLAATGVATELETLLASSALTPLFANVATTLGATTAAVISGYVSALIAAYSQGWISNEQLFNLSNHVAWIQSGFKVIVAAAGAGVAIGEIPSLLSYFGVSNNVLNLAMTAVGGAATSAGIALGIASVMAKCVRHCYWGQ